MGAADPPKAPDATFVRQRFIPRRRVDWAQECDRIMLEHGSVDGSTVYATRHQARWRAQSLIRLMTELRMHERWELREHVDRKEGGFVWTVEYLGRHGQA